MSAVTAPRESGHTFDSGLRSTNARDGSAFAGLATGLRVLLVAGVLSFTGASAADLASLHDGQHYLAIASALDSPGELRALPGHVRRLAPGYPLLVRLFDLALPLAVAALLVPVLAAGVATWLLRALGASTWTAAYFAVFTPSWLVFSSTAMSEAPFLALTLGGVLLWRRGRGSWAGLALGAATLVRPVGALVFLSLWLLGLRRRGPVLSAPSLLAWSALPVAWALTSWWLWGNPFEQTAAYADKDLSWPLHSMVVGLGQPWHDPLKAGQVLLALLLAALGGLGLRRRWLATRDPARAEDGAWLASHLGFYLLLPSSWVFECLPRFLVSCLPPILCGLEPWLPRRKAAVAAAAMASLALSGYWTLRALGQIGSGT
jgi:hypothetical protein